MFTIGSEGLFVITQRCLKFRTSFTSVTLAAFGTVSSGSIGSHIFQHTPVKNVPDLGLKFVQTIQADLVSNEDQKYGIHREDPRIEDPGDY